MPCGIALLREPWGMLGMPGELAGELRDVYGQQADRQGGSGRQPRRCRQRRDRRGPARSRGYWIGGPTVMETFRRHDEGPDLLARHKADALTTPTIPESDRAGSALITGANSGASGF